MNRLALFTVVLIAVVALGSQSQTRHGGSLNKSLKDMCVCVPTRAALMVKSAIAKTQAGSAQLFASAQ